MSGDGGFLIPSPLMKTLDRYILRQLVIVTLLGVLSLTMLLLLGQLFKELHTLLVESGAPPSIVIDFILQVVPFSLTFSVPWGFLTAVLLVYGRLAADNELTSMRMAGLNLWRLSAPAIGLGIILSALCYYINIEIAPKGKQAMSEIVANAAVNNPRNLLQSTQDAIKLDKVQLYIESRQGDNLYGVHVYPLDDNDCLSGGNFNTIHAQSATIGDFDQKTRQLQLTLFNSTIEKEDHSAMYLPVISRIPLQIHIPNKTTKKLKSNRFTNEEIGEILHHIDNIRGIQADQTKIFQQAAAEAPAFPCASALWAEVERDVRYYSRDLLDNVKNERTFLTERTKRASFSIACLVFSLIGVPLAITARRRDTSTGFAIGILVAAIYFLALVLCEISRKSAGATPYIVLWLPNILCFAYALWQHQKAKYRG